MTVKFANLARSVISNTLSAGATTLAISPVDADRFPNPAAGEWFPIIVFRAENPTVREIMHVTARSDILLTVQRGREDTSARSFSVGDVVELRLTAAAMESLLQENPDGDLTVGGTLYAGDADLGRPPIVSDMNDVVTTRFFTTTSASTSNTPPGVTGTAVGLNICRDVGNDDQAQVYFTTSSGNLSAGVWARAGRDNWSSGAPSDWWRFVMENPSGNVSVSGTISGNGSGLTSLNASNLSSGTLPAARLPNHSADLLTSGTLSNGRLSGHYSFGSLELTNGGVKTEVIHVGSGNAENYIHRDRKNSTLLVSGGDAGNDGSNILLRGSEASDGRGEIRIGSTVMMQWDENGIEIRNSSSSANLNTPASVSSTSSAGTTTFPIGHTLAVRDAVNPDRNASVTVRLNTENTHSYVVGGAGTALDGVWRTRGSQDGSSSVDAQRVS